MVSNPKTSIDPLGISNLFWNIATKGVEYSYFAPGVFSASTSRACLATYQVVTGCKTLLEKVKLLSTF